jgi:hypothetical protein
MEVVPKHSTLEANEKGQNIYTNDVDSSQISSPGELDEYPDPDAGKSDEERARLVRRLFLIGLFLYADS